MNTFPSNVSGRTAAEKETPRATILIVDDDYMIRNMLKTAMERSGYICHVAENGEDALSKLYLFSFDLVVTDIDMPKMNGIELARKLITDFSADVIVMTGLVADYQYEQIITIGASDFFPKPFSVNECILRVGRVLRERQLRKEARESHEELKEAYIDSIHRLVMAAEFKDEDTGDHIVRIGKYSSLIARKINLSASEIETISYAAPMHDIGKIGIPDKILMKPGKLTQDEFDIIKQHTVIGARLLSRSKSKILQMAHDIALFHHEKFNGQGYPNKLQGEDIPVEARIVAIADTFDALTSKRPYKDPYPPEMVFDIIRNEGGKQFDPEMVGIFTRHFDDFLEIREKIGGVEQVVLEKFTLSQRDQVHFQSMISGRTVDG